MSIDTTPERAALLRQMADQMDRERYGHGFAAAALREYAALITADLPEAQQAQAPDGLSRSDAESWLRHRAGIIEACRAEGYTIVTTAQGVHLMKLGKIAAQAPGWQPIETAPENTEREVVVQWIDSDGALCRDLDYREDGCWMGWHNHAEHVEVIGGHGVSYTPPYTEWMPIPAPQQGSKT